MDRKLLAVADCCGSVLVPVDKWHDHQKLHANKGDLAHATRMLAVEGEYVEA